MSKGIYYLVYTSIASRLISDEDLLLLLQQSRRNNFAFGITGLLRYMEGVQDSGINGVLQPGRWALVG
ncbi:BLUF domain-containing protein [uncultured Pedobacter sp.]|uniref:BLUF domain-containing protein n=1 Tax=uncultured Pedobacter sp. TaxID=246139 RepID=UPI00345B671A